MNNSDFWIKQLNTTAHTWCFLLSSFHLNSPQLVSLWGEVWINFVRFLHHPTLKKFLSISNRKPSEKYQESQEEIRKHRTSSWTSKHHITKWIPQGFIIWAWNETTIVHILDLCLQHSPIQFPTSLNVSLCLRDKIALYTSFKAWWWIFAEFYSARRLQQWMLICNKYFESVTLLDGCWSVWQELLTLIGAFSENLPAHGVRSDYAKIYGAQIFTKGLHLKFAVFMVQ